MSETALVCKCARGSKCASRLVSLCVGVGVCVCVRRRCTGAQSTAGKEQEPGQSSQAELLPQPRDVSRIHQLVALMVEGEAESACVTRRPC